MTRPSHVAARIAHLIGPGQLGVVNARPAYKPVDAPVLRLDVAALEAIYCYGRVSLTDGAVRLLTSKDVPVVWFTPGGRRCQGRMTGASGTSGSLRMLQHKAFADPAFKLGTAKGFVQGKLQSMALAYRHFQRHGQGGGDFLKRLRTAQEHAMAAGSLDVLRGVEGAASAAWFAHYAQLFLSPWSFPGRVRRPPTDPINALLSLGYTWLMERASTRVQAVGLEPLLGALHEPYPGRPALACDLIEPFRVPLVDRWVWRLVVRSEIAPAQFQSNPERGTRLLPEAFPEILTSWETHWYSEGHEAAFDQSLQDLTAALRLYPSKLPTPSEGPNSPS